MKEPLEVQTARLYEGTRLYHGTTTEHEEIDLSKCRHNTDFGKGYYLTSIPFQAEQWAKRKNEGWVYEYAVKVPETVTVLSLPHYDTKWLNIIACCRTTEAELKRLNRMESTTSYDIIAGGLADKLKGAELTLTIADYLNRRASPVDVLKKIEPRRIMDQFCFKTEKALRLLRRVRAWKFIRHGNEWKWEDIRMSGETRLGMLANMFAYITGGTVREAKNQILETESGRAIGNNSPVYLYNQPTHNLEELAEELPPDVQAVFTYEKIVEAWIETAHGTIPPAGRGAEEEQMTKGKREKRFADAAKNLMSEADDD